VKETRVVLTDDLARTEGTGPVEADLTVWLAYSVAGGMSAQVELELTADHEAELGKLLARYLAAGHHPDNPGTLPKQPRVYRQPAAGAGPYGSRGRETFPATRRLMAYARHRGIDIFHKADGAEYSNGKPYISPTLKADYEAFVKTAEGKTWLAQLSPEDGGER
jgi:hypothetical protein